MNTAISISPEATPGNMENGGQRSSSLSMIGRDTSQPFGTAPRGIGYEHTDTVATGEELHVTSKTPEVRTFNAGSRLVICLASITSGGRELGLGFGHVDVVDAGGNVILTLDKDHPQQILTLSGTYTFKFTHTKWYSDAPPCADVAIALAV